LLERREERFKREREAEREKKKNRFKREAERGV
jgi:hypothetical protein